MTKDVHFNRFLESVAIQVAQVLGKAIIFAVPMINLRSTAILPIDRLTLR
jgi:hypothetical protein